jgi:hypothetical protein
MSITVGSVTFPLIIAGTGVETDPLAGLLLMEKKAATRGTGSSRSRLPSAGSASERYCRLYDVFTRSRLLKNERENSTRPLWFCSRDVACSLRSVV